LGAAGTVVESEPGWGWGRHCRQLRHP